MSIPTILSENIPMLDGHYELSAYLFHFEDTKLFGVNETKQKSTRLQAKPFLEACSVNPQNPCSQRRQFFDIHTLEFFMENNVQLISHSVLANLSPFFPESI